LFPRDLGRCSCFRPPRLSRGGVRSFVAALVVEFRPSARSLKVLRRDLPIDRIEMWSNLDRTPGSILPFGGEHRDRPCNLPECLVLWALNSGQVRIDPAWTLTDFSIVLSFFNALGRYERQAILKTNVTGDCDYIISSERMHWQMKSTYVYGARIRVGSVHRQTTRHECDGLPPFLRSNQTTLLQGRLRLLVATTGPNIKYTYSSDFNRSTFVQVDRFLR